MVNIQYITDQTGEQTAVVIPIQLWRRLFQVTDEQSEETLENAIEDYCLNQAMDEAKQSPLLNRAEAIAFLET